MSLICKVKAIVGHPNSSSKSRAPLGICFSDCPPFPREASALEYLFMSSTFSGLNCPQKYIICKSEFSFCSSTAKIQLILFKLKTGKKQFLSIIQDPCWFWTATAICIQHGSENKPKYFPFPFYNEVFIQAMHDRIYQSVCLYLSYLQI